MDIIRNAEWIMLPKLLSPEQCAALVVQAISWNEPMVGDMSFTNNTEYPEIRSSDLRWLYRVNPAWKWAYDILDPTFDIAAEHFGLTADIPHDALQFTTYFAERLGHYDWHTDAFYYPEPEPDRKISLCLQLSDPKNYQGGELQMSTAKAPDPETLAAQGTAILFPSTVYHRVKHTTSGIRNSCVAWKYGPSWKPCDRPTITYAQLKGL